MKISLNWLTDYVDVAGRAVGELGEVLTRIGLCCDGIIETDTDVVFDLDVTSNRPDCLGHIGVARELAAALEIELKLPVLDSLPASAPPASELTDVKVLDPDLCPRYTARVIRGIQVAPSPRWLVERLEAVGLRGVNNVVDATNYVLMEYSQPLHAFDYRLLAENRIVVRRAAEGEEIVSIDGSLCKLTADMLIIADAERPVAVAGIMGGLDSEISEKTTDVLIESARFDPLTTRRTARALSLMSESSFRFERGVDPVGVDLASRRACQIILDIAGGELADGVVDAWAGPFEPAQVTMRTQRCRDLLGVDVDDATQAGILDRLGLSARLADGVVTCTIPSHRPDLTREADLIEEVARLYGYDRIPVRPKVTHRVIGLDPTDRARAGIRDVLSAAGVDEAVTFSFTDDPDAGLWGFAEGVHVDSVSRRTTNLLRPTVLTGLLRACKTNQDVGNESVSLYELSAVFPVGDRADGLPAEFVELGIVTDRDVQALRGVVEAVVDRVTGGSARLRVTPESVPGLAQGASAVLTLDGKPIGRIGQLAQNVLAHYGLEGPRAAATLNVSMLLSRAGGARAYQVLPKFPSVQRDLSLVVDEAVAWRQIADVIDSVRQRHREAVEYVTTYRGKPIPAGRKSLTVSLTYRSDQGTLRREDVDAMTDEIVQAMANRLGASLRE